MDMRELIWLIPALPLASAALLICANEKLPRSAVAALGVGSVGIAALCVLFTVIEWAVPGADGRAGETIRLHLWDWLSVGPFKAAIAFEIDGLTAVMMCVITGVGFLIHLYSAEFMAEDESYARYFAYLNLFVSAMLILVMADNLLLLYLGWEGVGACSYLLVGFWYKDAANGAAARKAFIVTRVGDTAMALGLFLLFAELGTLEFREMGAAARERWAVGDPVAVLATMLLLGGAVGKSAQLPLHTWLPDAMAGPTPVSALIHAATMVTAGVYLIGRAHELFLLAPPSLTAVAVLGVLTLLLAAFTALNQSDIKRVLAYSTISQIGYMFLGLGVGAWTAGIFHLTTHAFFKALLFLGAGAVIHCLHHEHNIFRMGGLRARLPIAFWSFLIGAAALAALPLTSGFFSKDLIVLAAYGQPAIGPWLWGGAVLGAFLTALYSFRLVFLVFLGEMQTEPDRRPGMAMAAPLAILCALSLLGGWIALPLDGVFPVLSGHPSLLIEMISIGVPILGAALAWMLFRAGVFKEAGQEAGLPARLWSWLRAFWHGGWGIDRLYGFLWVQPYQGLTRLLRGEPLDYLYHGIARANLAMNSAFCKTQTGRMRWYATVMAGGFILLLGGMLALAL